MEEMITMMAIEALKGLVKKSFIQEVKDMDIKMDVDFGDKDLGEYCKVAMDCKIGYFKVEVIDKDGTKVVNNYGLKEEA